MCFVLEITIYLLYLLQSMSLMKQDSLKSLFPPYPSLLKFSKPPLIMLSSFSYILIRLCLVLWGNLMALMEPSLNHLPRWSLTKPMTSTTITISISLPFLSLSLVFRPFSALYTFFTFHHYFIDFLNCLYWKKKKKLFFLVKFFL